MAVEKKRVWEHRFAFLTHAALIPAVRKADLQVLAYLLETYNVDKDECNPKLSTIAKAIRSGTAQVQRSIRQLTELGLIDIPRKDAPGRYRYRPRFERSILPLREQK